MKRENGIKEMITERNNVEDNNTEGEESEDNGQSILVAGETPWQESMRIIAAKGSIRGTKIY